jgi:hypothetical protein
MNLSNKYRGLGEKVKAGRKRNSIGFYYKLEMEGNLIDKYITKFRNLLQKAKIPRTEVRSLQKFKDGLYKRILSNILKKDTWPETINKWQEQARYEVQQLGIIRESLGEKGNYHLSTKQARWQSLAQQLKTPKQRKDEPIPTDIDASILQPRNPEREVENL